MDDREFEDRLMPDLVRIHGEPLDPNLVAAYVDGALEEPELSEVRARVAQDPEALLLVRALSETGAPVAHSRPAMVLTAAAVVAALLLVALGASWFGRDEQVDAAGLDTRLTVAASNLGERRPDLFEGFTPFESDELSPRSTPARGGAVWIAPRGLLLTHPSELRWKNPPGATRVELVLAGPDIDWRRELDEERLPVADLGPGRYVITLRGLDTLAGQGIAALVIDRGHEGVLGPDGVAVDGGGDAFVDLDGPRQPLRRGHGHRAGLGRRRARCRARCGRAAAGPDVVQGGAPAGRHHEKEQQSEDQQPHAYDMTLTHRR